MLVICHPNQWSSEDWPGNQITALHCLGFVLMWCNWHAKSILESIFLRYNPPLDGWQGRLCKHYPEKMPIDNTEDINAVCWNSICEMPCLQMNKKYEQI
jgi:hypothetical protein